MNIIFLGATNFSYTLLESLLKHKFSISCIFTLPKEFNISYSKKPVKIYNYADLKSLGEKYNIDTVELSGSMLNYYGEFKKRKPDLILALGWYFMVPRKIREIAPLGCIGIHASFLPEYAGGAPLVWAMINGERNTGVSLFYFDGGVDTGDIIAQKKIVIGRHEDIKTLYIKATKESGKLLFKYLPLIEKGVAPKFKQDLRKRKEYPHRFPKDGLIKWVNKCEEIRNFVRAQTKPYPGAFSHLRKMPFTIWASRVVSSDKRKNYSPGQIAGVLKEGLLICAGDKGNLLVASRVNADGKEYSGRDFALKYRIKEGELLT